MLPDQTPAQGALVRSGVPVGFALLLVAGAIGLMTDSTFAGIVAGAGLMMMIGSFVLKRN